MDLNVRGGGHFETIQVGWICQVNHLVSMTATTVYHCSFTEMKSVLLKHFLQFQLCIIHIWFWDAGSVANRTQIACCDVEEAWLDLSEPWMSWGIKGKIKAEVDGWSFKSVDSYSMQAEQNQKVLFYFSVWECHSFNLKILGCFCLS